MYLNKGFWPRLRQWEPTTRIIPDRKRKRLSSKWVKFQKISVSFEKCPDHELGRRNIRLSNGWFASEDYSCSTNCKVHSAAFFPPWSLISWWFIVRGSSPLRRLSDCIIGSLAPQQLELVLQERISSYLGTSRSTLSKVCATAIPALDLLRRSFVCWLAPKASLQIWRWCSCSKPFLAYKCNEVSLILRV